MPAVEVLFYKEVDGAVPVRDWLSELQRRQPRAFVKCRARIERLAEVGYEIRRPEADFLRDGIYELRIRFGTVNYRLLYFFHGQTAAVLAHALTKEAAVSIRDIDRAIERREKFVDNPVKHTYREPVAGEVEEDDENYE
jgi:putative component of toxin-antitoxin plasmid stabilization module